MKNQPSTSVDELGVDPSKSRSSSFDKLKATVKLTWFLTVSIAALSLSVAVVFSGYDSTTSKVAISSIKPLKVINSLGDYINADGSVSNSSVPDRNFTVTSEILGSFALDVLPYEYRFGMTGICRLYNISTPNITCTRSLGNTPSIISVLTTDLNSTYPKSLSNWITLLDVAQAAGKNPPVPLDLLSRLTRASSALLLTSVSLSPFEIALTLYLFFKTQPYNFRKRLFGLYILDGVMMLASATLYTGCIYSIGSYTIDGDISPNFGFILFWCAGAGKFLVTPTMFFMSFLTVTVVAVYAALFTVKVTSVSAAVALAAVPNGGTTVDTVWYGGDSGFSGGDSGC